MLQVQLLGILGLIAIAACWALAVVLYRVGTTGSVARKLALLLAIEGIILLTAAFPEFALGIYDPGNLPTEEFVEQYFLYFAIQALVHHLADASMLAFYPLFLAAALQTKLTKAFGERQLRVVMAVVSIVLFLGFLIPVAIWRSPVGQIVLYIAMMLMFGFGLVASIHAWHTATSSEARVRAGVFALAFGVRDICWGFTYAVLIWANLPQQDSIDVANPVFLAKTFYALGSLLAVPLIAYGILRAHLFDIDLRIRWTIKQSTLATVVVTFIFLISEAADRYLSAELGNFAGLFAAAIVVFFLAPLQRFAERVASAAMPNTENTPEYAAYRKMQVYEAAVSEALPDGNISERERALLNSLRDSLGISTADAESLERELRPVAVPH